MPLECFKEQDFKSTENIVFDVVAAVAAVSVFPSSFAAAMMASSHGNALLALCEGDPLGSGDVIELMKMTMTKIYIFTIKPALEKVDENAVGYRQITLKRKAWFHGGVVCIINAVRRSALTSPDPINRDKGQHYSICRGIFTGHSRLCFVVCISKFLDSCD